MIDNVTPTQADLIKRLRATPYNETDPEGALFLEASEAIATQAAENERLRAALRKVKRTAELSAGIMRNAERTGSWEGAEKTARAFDRISVDARAALSAQPSDQERCEYCDGTGHVHREDGELLGACPTCPTPPAGKARPTAAIEQLRDHQQQLDQDGCFVGVSRQAIDEVLQYIGEQP